MFSDLKIPLVGGNNAQRKLTEKKADEFQKEMNDKLRLWEIENGVYVEPVLQRLSSNSELSFRSMIMFHKLTPEQINEFKRLQNEREATKGTEEVK